MSGGILAKGEPRWQGKARVISNSELLPQVHLLWLEAPEIAGAARPGQFVTVRCGEGSAPLLRRPLSIHRVGQNRRGLALLFAVVGEGTRWLARRREGERLDALGPLGNGFEVARVGQRPLLIAGGIGVAPLVFLAEEALARGAKATMLLGWRTAAQLYPADLLPPGIEVAVATEDGTTGHHGLVTALAPRFLPESDAVSACGPLDMYRSLAAQAGAFGGRPAHVLLEAVMGCGVGGCLGCAVPTKEGMRLVCKDGPVFRLDDILWEEMAPAAVGRACR